MSDRVRELHDSLSGAKERILTMERALSHADSSHVTPRGLQNAGAFQEQPGTAEAAGGAPAKGRFAAVVAGIAQGAAGEGGGASAESCGDGEAPRLGTRVTQLLSRAEAFSETVKAAVRRQRMDLKEELAARKAEIEWLAKELEESIAEVRVRRGGTTAMRHAPCTPGGVRKGRVGREWSVAGEGNHQLNCGNSTLAMQTERFRKEAAQHLEVAHKYQAALEKAVPMTPVSGEVARRSRCIQPCGTSCLHPSATHRHHRIACQQRMCVCRVPVQVSMAQQTSIFSRPLLSSLPACRRGPGQDAQHHELEGPGGHQLGVSGAPQQARRGHRAGGEGWKMRAGLLTLSAVGLRDMGPVPPWAGAQCAQPLAEPLAHLEASALAEADIRPGAGHVAEQAGVRAHHGTVPGKQANTRCCEPHPLRAHASTYPRVT